MTYIPVHGSLGPVRTYLTTLGFPVPASGSLGSLALRGSYKAGARLVVITAGQRYVYFVISDFQAVDNFLHAIPVVPAIQTLHVVGDQVEGPYPDYQKSVAMNAIVSANPRSVNPLYASAGYVVPYLREWPDATDPFGLSWDQSNILALSVEPIAGNNPFFAEMIPVPRTLGAEYTKFSQRSRGMLYGYYGTGSARGVSSPYDISWPYQYRNAAGAWNSRAQLKPYPHYFSSAAAEPDDGTYPEAQVATGTAGMISVPIFYPDPWILLRATTEYPNLGASGYAPGSRGGQYSFCGRSFDADTGTQGTFTIEIRGIYPGLGDVLLHSVLVSSGALLWGPVASGTWSGIVLPTDGTGAACSHYLKLIPTNPGPNVYTYLTYGSGAVIASSTQVPWGHTVVTGNLVAPGGLIAPFY